MVNLEKKTYGNPLHRKAVELHDSLNSDGGGSVSLLGWPTPTTGFMVGGVVPSTVTKTCTYQTIDSFLAATIGELLQSNRFAGIWQGPDAVYLDVSEWVADEQAAVALGRARGELAIYNLATGTDIQL